MGEENERKSLVLSIFQEKDLRIFREKMIIYFVASEYSKIRFYNQNIYLNVRIHGEGGLPFWRKSSWNNSKIFTYTEKRINIYWAQD